MPLRQKRYRLVPLYWHRHLKPKLLPLLPLASVFGVSLFSTKTAPSPTFSLNRLSLLFSLLKVQPCQEQHTVYAQ